MNECSELRSTLFYKKLYNYIKKRDPNRAAKLKAVVSLMSPDSVIISAFDNNNALNKSLSVFKDDIADFVVHSEYSFNAKYCVAVAFYCLGELTFEQYTEYLIEFANRYGYLDMLKRMNSNVYIPSFEDMLKILKSIYFKQRDIRLLFAVEQSKSIKDVFFSQWASRIREVYRELFGAELYLVLSEECPHLVKKHKDKLDDLTFIHWWLSNCLEELDLRPFIIKFITTNRYLPFYLDDEVFYLYASDFITIDEYKLFCINSLRVGYIKNIWKRVKDKYFSMQDLVEMIETSDNKVGCRFLIEALYNKELISIKEYKQLLKLVNKMEDKICC